jgi:hypothetical protein
MKSLLAIVLVAAVLVAVSTLAVMNKAAASTLGALRCPRCGTT